MSAGNERELEPHGPLVGGRSQLHLVGFMGVGKSTVGQRLARRMLWNFLDLDTLVERHTGLRVAEIFGRRGEGAFREAESHCLAQAVLKPRTVLALGGGAWESAGNRRLARARGVSVWLDCPLAVIRERLGAAADERPLWDDPAKIRRRYDARRETYARADLRVEADGAPDAVAERVLSALASI